MAFDPPLFENIRVVPLDGGNLRSKIGLGAFRRLDIASGAVVCIKRKSVLFTDSIERRNVQKWPEFLELSSHLFIGLRFIRE